MSARVLGAAALALVASTGAAQGTGFYGLTGVRDIHGNVREPLSVLGHGPALSVLATAPLVAVFLHRAAGLSPSFFLVFWTGHGLQRVPRNCDACR